ncbi:hypothetical protein DFP95_101473 [Cohnella lupini]|uniref:Uncharacterized protein n=1 Tax=Cohnella lupini TaxID=1294267 RepID=A0A3D9IW97_9BACL|nr:hypothetical protein DFP95_101473 [Cohnella lupini]
MHYHHHILEEQVREQSRAIRFIDRNGWKWNSRRRRSDLMVRISNFLLLNAF